MREKIVRKTAKRRAKGRGLKAGWKKVERRLKEKEECRNTVTVVFNSFELSVTDSSDFWFCLLVRLIVYSCSWTICSIVFANLLLWQFCAGLSYLQYLFRQKVFKVIEFVLLLYFQKSVLVVSIVFLFILTVRHPLYRASFLRHQRTTCGFPDQKYEASSTPIPREFSICHHSFSMDTKRLYSEECCQASPRRVPVQKCKFHRSLF